MVINNALCFYLLRINYQIHGDMALNETDCLIIPPDFVGDYFRPPLDCSECANVRDIITVKNLSPVSTDFLLKKRHTYKYNCCMTFDQVCNS